MTDKLSMTALTTPAAAATVQKAEKKYKKQKLEGNTSMVQIRVPEDDHIELKVRATREKTSVQEIVNKLITDYLKTK